MKYFKLCFSYLIDLKYLKVNKSVQFKRGNSET